MRGRLHQSMVKFGHHRSLKHGGLKSNMNYSHSRLFKGRCWSDFRLRRAVKLHQSMIKYCYHRSRTYGGLKSNINESDLLAFQGRFRSDFRPRHAR